MNDFPSENHLAEPFDFLLHGLLGVDYVLHLDVNPTSSARCEIESEERKSGGLMWHIAHELAQDTKSRVVLSSNAIGNDSNGRLVLREIEARKTAFFWIEKKAEIETPYRVVLRSDQIAPIVLTRYQAAEIFDCEKFPISSTLSDNWPRAKIVCATDELPFSALHLARWAQRENLPFYLGRTSNEPHDEFRRAALQAAAALARRAWDFESRGAAVLLLLAELWNAQEK